jgi:hypothetical protein
MRLTKRARWLSKGKIFLGNQEITIQAGTTPHEKTN